MSINADRNGDSSPGLREVPPLEPKDAGTPHAAARLLEITARETEQWRADARVEADAIVAGARDEAGRLVRDAREEAERLVAAAREESAQISNQARVVASRVREETTAARTRHDEEVTRLKQVANEHQERLRRHLTAMLDQVDAIASENSQ